MRKLLALFVALGLVLLTECRGTAADRDKALAVIEEAIKAHGGEEALAKALIATRTGKGAMTLFGKEAPFTEEFMVHFPDRFRLALDVEMGGQSTKVTLVYAGDKGWQATGGSVVELSKERLEELREFTYAFWLTTLMPLKKDSAFELATLPEADVKGQPARGVKVTCKGHNEVKLFFDKKSGLLVKLERRGQEAGLPVHKEYFFSDHKSFDGVKLATKHIELSDGKKFIEGKVESYKFPRKIDDSVFSKP